RKTGRRPSILATDLENAFTGENETRSWIDEQPDNRLNHRPGAETERKEIMEEHELAVARLPEKMGDAFRMREMLGYTTEEITRELKISKANLWVLIHRAKQILSTELSENWNDVDHFGGRMAA